MAVTVKEVAARVGVSVPTVVQALGGRGRLRPATRQRVLRAAQELGYKPHSSARAMRAGRCGCVALLLSTFRSHSLLPDYLLDGIQSVLVEGDMHLTVASLPDEKLTSEGFVPKLLREWAADGMLVNYNARIPQRMIELIAESQTPTVWINSKHHANCVHPDDLRAGAEATRGLLSLGHRRIAFVNYTTGYAETPWHYSAIDRQAGYEQAMRDAGLPPRRISDAAAVRQEDFIPFTREWLAGAERPTAVIPYSPRDARVVLATALRLGLRVPEDLSVVTFTDAPFADMGWKVSAMLIPGFDIGRAAAQLLLERIEDPTKELPPQAVAMHWEPGQTCCPPSP